MTAASATLDPSTFDFVRKLVQDCSAITLEAGKEYLVESRLMPLAKQHGLTSLTEMVVQLKAQPRGALQTQVVEAMTTNETSFFRDFHPFEVLRATIIPALIASRAARKSLNIWSSACSSGQEPYTIAMLLREHFPALRDWKVSILATDLSQQMVERARQGRFSQLEVSRGLPLDLLAKYFVRSGLHWQIKPDVQRGIRFQRANLIESWPAMATMDIVFMRNVLIYFTPETKRGLLSRLKKQLAPDGVLFLGGAETTIGIDDQWQRVCHGKTSTYRLAASHP